MPMYVLTAAPVLPGNAGDLGAHRVLDPSIIAVRGRGAEPHTLVTTARPKGMPGSCKTVVVVEEVAHRMSLQLSLGIRQGSLP